MNLKIAAAVLAVACLVTGAIYFPRTPHHPFYYDEADYMWASKQGLVANAIDRNGISFPEFVRKGLELSRSTGARQSFSQYVRELGDIGMYRHYHGPMYAYWLATLHNLGVTREDVFRGSGLLLHALTAFVLFFSLNRSFPGIPWLGPLAAGLLMLASRTALTGATAITQHVIFSLLTAVVLGLYSEFFRTREPRWAYLGMAMNGVALSTVETAVVLGGAFGLAWLIDWRRQFEMWKTWGQRIGFLARCLGSVILGVLVVWPTGILQLNILKGYLTLVYIAVYRKTFSPIGPLELLLMKFEVAPFELGLLILGTGLAVYLFRKQPAAWPWLCFAGLFCLVILKVTAPYTYYYAPLTTAMCALTGLVAGELWRRDLYVKVLTAGAIALSLIGGTWQASEDLQEVKEKLPPHFALLEFVRKQPAPGGRALYLPYQMVPTMHYYHPEWKTVGYDIDWEPQRLVEGVTSPQAYDRVLCEEKTCALLAERLPGRVTDRQFLDPAGPNGGIFYAVRVAGAAAPEAGKP